jgi:hypothetical protein
MPSEPPVSEPASALPDEMLMSAEVTTGFREVALTTALPASPLGIEMAPDRRQLNEATLSYRRPHT